MSDLYVDTGYWDTGYAELEGLSSGGGGGGRGDRDWRKNPKYTPGLMAIPKIPPEPEPIEEEPIDHEFEAWFASVFYPSAGLPN